MLWIHAQTHRDFDGLIEFGEFNLLEKRNRFFEWIGTRFDLLRSRLITLSCFLSHISSI